VPYWMSVVAINPRAWAKRKLILPPDVTLLTWLTRSEAAAVLGGIPRTSLYRMALRNEGPPCVDTFSGVALRYRVLELLAWYGKVTGLLPATVQGVGDWWLAEGRNITELRAPPTKRGTRQRGIKSQRWGQVARERSRRALLPYQLAIAALNAKHSPQVQRELLDLAQGLLKAPEGL